MNEGSRRLPKMVHLVGLFFRQDPRVQRERWRARQFTLLLVFPGLEGVLKCLGHRAAVSHRAPLSREASTGKHCWDTRWTTARKGETELCYTLEGGMVLEITPLFT